MASSNSKTKRRRLRGHGVLFVRIWRVLLGAHPNRLCVRRLPRSPKSKSSAHHGEFMHLSTGRKYDTQLISCQPPPKSKGGKMLSLINWRLKVTINDGRAFVGQMLAFDRHMNLVIADCEEFRRVRPKKKPGETEAGPVQEMKRTLGLVILRGETVVSLSVEGPPPVTDEDKKNAVRRISRSDLRWVLGMNWVMLIDCRNSQLPFGPGRGAPAGRGIGMMPPGESEKYHPTAQ